MLGRIHQDIRDGASLHDAFRRHPNVFSPLYCSMLKAGESAGALPEILDRLVYVIEHEHKVKSDVKSAMTYPIIVLAFLADRLLHPADRGRPQVRQRFQERRPAAALAHPGLPDPLRSSSRNTGTSWRLLTVAVGVGSIHLRSHRAGAVRARHPAAQAAAGRQAPAEVGPLALREHFFHPAVQRRRHPGRHGHPRGHHRERRPSPGSCRASRTGCAKAAAFPGRCARRRTSPPC